MTTTITNATPGPREGTVRSAEGEILTVPEGWSHLPPGDALVTRRVKAAGPYWAIGEWYKRRLMSRGIFAPTATIERVRAAVEAERGTAAYKQRLEAGRARRSRAEEAYVKEFTREVEAFLAFSARHASIAAEMAARIAEHATPVGSGTVARTSRIPVAERAEAATIAWMRHRTTAYDFMDIGRAKGERREVRRALADESRRVLRRYRRGEDPEPGCPLMKALVQPRPGDVLPPEKPSAAAKKAVAKKAIAATAARSEAAQTKTRKDPRSAAANAPSAPVAPAPGKTPAKAATPAPEPPAPKAPPAADDPEMARRTARQAAIRARLSR
jgi:hypothetical protein